MKPQAANRKEAILSALSAPERNGHTVLQILAADIPLESEGSLDALALDPFGRLVLLFLGPKEEPSWFSSILDSLAWLENHHDLLRSRFSLGENVSDLPPRILLISPEFPGDLPRRLSALRGLDISLLEAAFTNLGGEKKIVFRPHALPHRKSSEPDGLPSWAIHPQAAAFLREAVEKVRKIDREIQIEWGPGQAELGYHSRPLGILQPSSGGLRILIAGDPVLEILATDRHGLVRGLDGIFRRYMETGLEALPAAPEKPSPERAEFPEGRVRPLLTEEEIEAFSK